MFKSRKEQLHLQNCLMREFYLNNKYFMNGIRPTTVPTFLDRDPQTQQIYIDCYITDDIVSVEFASNKKFKLPFESAHCYATSRDLLATPITSQNDVDHNDDKMNNVLKIINRIKTLQPPISFTSIYHCLLSVYREEKDVY